MTEEEEKEHKKKNGLDTSTVISHIHHTVDEALGTYLSQTNLQVVISDVLKDLFARPFLPENPYLYLTEQLRVVEAGYVFKFSLACSIEVFFFPLSPALSFAPLPPPPHLYMPSNSFTMIPPLASVSASKTCPTSSYVWNPTQRFPHPTAHPTHLHLLLLLFIMTECGAYLTSYHMSEAT